MNHRRRLLGWGAVFIVVCQFASGLAQAAPPPLRPNEEVVKTKDGCGMVIDKTSSGAAYQRKAFSELTWGGACVDGLAMGEGILSAGIKFPNQPAMLPITGWVWYGRPFGPTETRWDNGAVQKNFVWEHKAVIYRSLDGKPVWSKLHSEGSQVYDGETMVSTLLANTPTISVYDKGKSQLYPCPDASSTQSCEALWAQHAGPVIERIKAFLAENEPKAKARLAEAQSLAAQWKSKQPAGAAEKKAADAKRAAEQEATLTAQKLKREQECWDKDNKLVSDSMAWKGMRYQGEERLGRALKALYEGECKGHVNAKNGLERANKYLSDAVAHRAEDEKLAKDTAAYEADKKKQKDEDLKLLGQVAGAVAAGGNRQERLKLAAEALSSQAGGGSLGTGAARPDNAGATPDPRCAFWKFRWDIDEAPLRLDSEAINLEPQAKLKKRYEQMHGQWKANGGEARSDARGKLAARRYKEWKETLDCVAQHGEFMLQDGETFAGHKGGGSLKLFPNEIQGTAKMTLLDDRGLSFRSNSHYPNVRAYPITSCGSVHRRDFLVLNRLLGEDRDLYSKFMLASQLAYLRGVYQELTTDSELIRLLEPLRKNTRLHTEFQSHLKSIEEVIGGLTCEEKLGFPYSVDRVFALVIKRYQGPDASRIYPARQIPRCPEKANTCALFD